MLLVGFRQHMDRDSPRRLPHGFCSTDEGGMMTRRHRNARLQCLDPYTDLCELIDRWVIRDVKEAMRSIGYPRKSLDFTMIQSPASSIDPTGYSAEDHGAIAVAVNKLADSDGNLFAAVSMYYKPWTIRAFAERGYPQAPTQTFYDRLVRAHAWLFSELRAEMAQREAMRKKERSQLATT